MPVVLIHQGPTVTAESYRATVQKLAGKDKMESVSDWPSGASFPTQPAKARADSASSTSGSPRTRATRSASTWHRSSKRSASPIRRRCTRRRPSFRASPAAPPRAARRPSASGPCGSRGRSRWLETLGQRRRKDEASSRRPSFSWKRQARTTTASILTKVPLSPVAGALPRPACAVPCASLRERGLARGGQCWNSSEVRVHASSAVGVGNTALVGKGYSRAGRLLFVPSGRLPNVV